MNELQALLLGVVQGLTEFLPISSSGHLILVPWLLNFHYLEQHPDFNKTFDVALHAGTLAAVVVYFRTELLAYARGFVRTLHTRTVETEDQRMAWLLALATVPAAAIGGVGESTIEDKLGQPWQIAILLAVFGIVLGLADRLPERRDMSGLGWRGALAIGFAQAVALAPGTSRSGITITAGRVLGLNRRAAARFSFLLLAPITFGAIVFEGADVAMNGMPAGVAGPFVVGILAAAASGFAAMWWMLRYLQTHNYDIFVVYRIFAAIVILGLIATGVQPATFD